MAIENSTQTTPARTPAWLAYYYRNGLASNDNALAGAMDAYLDSMNAFLDLLAIEGNEANVVQQLALSGYHRTLEMREFFDAWQNADEDDAGDTPARAGADAQTSDSGITAAELQKLARKAFVRSMPVPLGMLLNEAFGLALDGKFAEAAAELDRLAAFGVVGQPAQVNVIDSPNGDSLPPSGGTSEHAAALRERMIATSAISKVHCHAVGISGGAGALIRDLVPSDPAMAMSPHQREGLIKGIDAAALAIVDDLERLGVALRLDANTVSGFWRYFPETDEAISPSALGANQLSADAV